MTRDLNILLIHPGIIALIEISFLVAAALLFIPVFVLLVECCAALLPVPNPVQDRQVKRPKLAVLVPAHNEAVVIDKTLQTLQAQLTNEDRLVVIADNCNDSTAMVARSHGATVVERQESERLGKGYALDYGLRFLELDPPDVVVMVDADCSVYPDAISQIACLAVSTAKPVQAAYLLSSSNNPRPKDAVSLLAFTVKNLVRPMGLSQLRLPCLLTGTGMAFPWAVICGTTLASSNIVEDMQLAVDLAISGHPPIFCSTARVTAPLPQTQHAAKSQRTRWEHGHLQTLLNQVPRLLTISVRQKRFDLLAVALDLCVPPLSLLVLIWAFATTIYALLTVLFGISWLPLILLAIEGMFVFLSIFAAWFKFSRVDLPLTTLLAVPLYILWKLPLYLSFLIRPQREWVRTERDIADTPKP